jgi:hypothetical protein
MSTRAEKFESLAKHPWMGRTFKKLSGLELRLARDFLAQNQNLDRGDFENWAMIMELLSNCNSAQLS